MVAVVDDAIRAAGGDDLPAVSDLLTEVFSTDPLMRAITAPAPDPLVALRHLHEAELSHHYLSGAPATPVAVDVATGGGGELLGVALWDAPSQEGANPSGPLGPGDCRGQVPAGIDLEVLGGAWELCLLDGQLCEAVRPLEPHWYLYMIAVSKRARGLGVGSRLLERGLGRADAAGVTTHLESTTLASKRLYERHGFREVAQIGPCGPLPRYWALTRPAQP